MTAESCAHIWEALGLLGDHRYCVRCGALAIKETR